MEDLLFSLSLKLNEFLVNFGSFVSPQYQQALIIGIGVFLIILLLGVTRRHMLNWSIKGAWFGVVFGIVVTLLVQGLLLVGGKTAVVEVVRNEKTPKNVRVFLQENITELAQSLASEPKTLGAQEELNFQDFIDGFSTLPKKDQQKVKNLICEP